MENLNILAEAGAARIPETQTPVVKLFESYTTRIGEPLAISKEFFDGLPVHPKYSTLAHCFSLTLHPNVYQTPKQLAVERMLSPILLTRMLFYDVNGLAYRMPVPYTFPISLQLQNRKLSEVLLAYENLIETGPFEPHMMKLGMNTNTQEFLSTKHTQINDKLDEVTAKLQQTSIFLSDELGKTSSNTVEALRDLKNETIKDFQERIESLTTTIRMMALGHSDFSPTVLDRIIGICLTIYNVLRAKDVAHAAGIISQYFITTGYLTSSRIFHVLSKGILFLYDFIVNAPTSFIATSLISFCVGMSVYLVGHMCFEKIKELFKVSKEEFWETRVDDFVAQAKNDIDFTSFIKKFTLAKSTAQTIEYFTKIFWSCFTWVYQRLFGVPFVTTNSREWITKSLAWIESVNQYVAANTKEKVNADVTAMRKIIDLSKEGNDLAVQLMALGYTSSNFSAFFGLLKRVADLAANAEFLLKNSQTRNVPLCVHLVGAPSTGKSVCLDMLIHDLWDYFRKTINTEFSKIEYTPNLRFERNPQDKYWANYTNQPFVTLDDFLQVDDIEVRTQCLDSIIHMVNSNPYPLVCAALDEKGKVKFDSLAVFLTSNTDANGGCNTPKVNLQDPQAFKGRRDYVFLVTVRNDCKSTIPGRSNFNLSKLDPEERKLVGETDLTAPFSRLVYEFTLIDPKTEKPVLGTDGKPIMYSYLTMLALCCMAMRTKRVPTQQVATFLAAAPINFELLQAEVFKFQPHMDGGDDGKEPSITDTLAAIINSAVKPFTPTPQPDDSDCKDPKAEVKLPSSLRTLSMETDSDTQYGSLEDDDTPPPIDLSKHVSYSDVTWKRKMKDLALDMSTYVDTFTHQVSMLYEKCKSFVSECPGIFAGILTTTGVVTFVTVIASITKWLYSNTLQPHHNPAATGASQGLATTMEPLRNTPSKRRFVLVAQDGNAIDILQSVTRSNSAKISVTVDMERISINTVFVFSNVCALPKHFANRITKDAIVTLRFFNDNRESMTLKGSDITTRIDDSENDLVFLRIPKLQPLRNLVDYFLTKDELANVNISRTSTLRYTVSNDGNHIPELITSENSRLAGKTSYSSEGQLYHSAFGLQYFGVFRKGDCGNLVAVRNELLARKLVGIHVAGSATVGRAAIMTQDDLIYLQTLFIDSKPELTGTVLPHSEVVGTPHYDYAHWRFVGNVPPALATRFPSKSEIVSTPYSGLLAAPRKRPAQLRPFYGVNGETISPLQKAITKHESDHAKPMDKTILQPITDAIFAKIGNKFPVRVLTESEAINGVYGTRFLKSIDMSTSQGYTGIPSHGHSSKLNLFVGEIGHYEPDSILRRRLDTHEETYSQGKSGISISTYHLKDELRLVQKVLEGKTRGFGCPETAHFIKCKQYFGAYVENIGLEPAKNGVALGIDPCSLDWESMHQEMLKINPDRQFDGDSTTHDGRAHPDLVDDFIRGVNLWYKRYDSHWCERDDLIRRGLMLDGTYDATLLIGADLVKPKRLIVSGIFLTFLFQSYTSHVIHRYVLYKTAEKYGFNCTIEDLFKQMYVLAGGDDYIHSVTKKFNWYTFTMFQKEVEEIGYTYTPPDKISQTYDYREVGKVEFLKRRFRFQDGLVYAPLDDETVLEIMNWKKKGIDNQTAFEASAQSVILEAFQHGEVFFDSVKERLNVAASHYGYTLVYHTYAELLKNYGVYNYERQYEFEPQMFTSKTKPTSLADQYYKLFNKVPDIQYSQVGLQFTAILQFQSHRFLSPEMKSKAEVRENVLQQFFHRFGVDGGVVTKPQEVKFTASSFADRFYHQFGDAPNITYEQCPGYFVARMFRDGKIHTGQGSTKAEARENAIRLYYLEYDKLPFFPHADVVPLPNPARFQPNTSPNSPPPPQFHPSNPFYEPHSMSEKVTPETNEGFVETKQLTTTKDMIVPEDGPNLGRFVLYKGTDPYPDSGMSQVLSRKYRISELAWSGSSVAGTRIFLGNFPWALFALSTVLADKVLGFQWFRAGVNVEFRVNATQFHYGKLLVCWLPHNDSTAGSSGWKLNNIWTASTCNAVELSANTTKTVSIQIPYTVPLPWWDTTRTSINWGDFGTVAIYVLNPLNLTNATSTPSVNVSIFANFINPEVAGPSLNFSTLKNDFYEMEPHMQTSTGEQREKSEKGVLSGVARAVSNITAAFSMIPLLPPPIALGATVVSAIAGAGARIASAFGYDKPQSTEITHKQHLETFSGLANGDGIFSGEELSLNNGMHLSTDSTSFNEKELCTTLTSIATKPGLFDQFTFDGTSLAGVVVSKHYVTPATCYVTQSVDTLTTVGALTPCAAVASLFKYGRGSQKYRIEFVCSSFLSFRARIAWHPTYAEIPALGSTLGQGEGDIISTVIDVCGDTSFNFSIPYLKDTMFMRLDDPHTKAESSSVGGISISIVNPCVAMQTTASTTVYCNWFIANDDDYCFHVLNDKPSGATGIRTYDTSFVFQANVIAQSENETTSVLNDIFAKKFPSLIPATAKMYHNVNVAEDTENIYTLVHKPTMLGAIANTLTASYTLSSTFPGNRLDPTLVTTGVNPLLLFLNWSLYYKGGFNHYITLAAASLDADFTDILTFLFSVDAGTVQRPANYGGTSLATGQTPYHHQRISTRSAMMVHEPYRSLLPYSSYSQKTSYAFNTRTRETTLGAYVLTKASETQIPIFWAYSADDDFRFAWFIGPPGYKIA